MITGAQLKGSWKVTDVFFWEMERVCGSFVCSFWEMERVCGSFVCRSKGQRVYQNTSLDIFVICLDVCYFTSPGGCSPAGL